MTTASTCWLLLLTAALSVLSTWADRLPESFDFKASSSLGTSFEPQQLYRVALEPWVYRNSLHFPNDLRIVDHEGRQWPFFLHIPQPAQVHWAQAELRNLRQMDTDGSNDCVSMEVRVQLNPDADALHDAIEIETTGTNYLRRVEIRVGAEGAQGLLAAGYLMNEGGASNRLIQYRPSSFRQLQVRVFGNLRTTEDRFEVLGVRVRRNNPQAEAVPLQALEVVASAVPEVETQEGSQTWILGLKQDCLMPESLRFEVNDLAFYRPITVFGREGTEGYWSWLGAGTVYRRVNDSNLTLPLPPTSRGFRYLKVVEQHHEDPPLAVQAIIPQATQRFLVFEARNTGPAQLLVGHSGLTRARYDLERRMQKQVLDALPSVTLAAPEFSQREHVRPGFLERNDKWIAGILVGVVACIILITVLRMSKRFIPPEED